MSFAWATVAIVVLLLPGFLYFYGLTFFERFNREVVQRDALGYLAAAVFIAFLVHSIAYLLLARWIDTTVVLAVLQLQGASRIPLDDVANSLEKSRLGIFLYVMSTCVAGLLIGIAQVRLKHSKMLEKSVSTSWLNDLKPDSARGVVYAYVLTHVQDAGRSLMYRGVIKEFGMLKDGRFAYLVLQDPTRFYMLLEKETPITTAPDTWKAIGSNAADAGVRNLSYLMIEGEDIANAVFERYAYEVSEELDKALDDVKKFAAFIGITPDQLDYNAARLRARAAPPQQHSDPEGPIPVEGAEKTP